MDAIQSEVIGYWRQIVRTLNQRNLLRDRPQQGGKVLPVSDAILLPDRCIFVLDMGRLGGIAREEWLRRELWAQWRGALRGRRVVVSDGGGLAIQVARRPGEKPRRLPRLVDFPGCERGTVRVGIDRKGRTVAVAWEDLGHILVAGMTGAGKSNLLRVLAYQAIHDGAELLLADLDGASFPMLQGHAALRAPIAGTPDEAHQVVLQALAECDRRAALYRQAAGYPEQLEEYNGLADGEPLPRLLVILDEFNATTLALGGPRGQFAGDAASLAWRGRKFGVNLVFAAQDFSKAVVGRVRDQVKVAICFKVRGPEVARNVGCAGAEAIPETRPGRAVTDRWGTIQVYFLDKRLLVGDGNPLPVLAGVEAALVRYAVENLDGCFVIGKLYQAHRGQISQRRLTALAQEWEQRGWLTVPKHATDARRVTPDLSALCPTLDAKNGDRVIGVIGGDREVETVIGELPPFLARRQKIFTKGDATCSG